MNLIEMQYFQEMHDRKYHIDIYSKPLFARLSHLHNHLVKYSANELARDSHYSDALAVILSMANAINLNLSEGLSKEQLKTVLSLDDIGPKHYIGVLELNYRNILGQMAKIIEGFDHAESLQYKDELKRLVPKLLELLTQIRTDLSEMSGGKVWAAEYVKTLFRLKEKHIFYAYYTQTDMQDPIYKSAYYFSKTLV